VANCVKQVSLTQSRLPVDEQRVILPWQAPQLQRRRLAMRETVAGTDDEGVERVLRVKSGGFDLGSVTVGDPRPTGLSTCAGGTDRAEGGAQIRKLVGLKLGEASKIGDGLGLLRVFGRIFCPKCRVNSDGYRISMPSWSDSAVTTC